MYTLTKAIKAIRSHQLTGWLFFDFHNRDKIAHKILKIQPNITNSRPWVYIVFADSRAVKIVHNIESSVLDHLDGEKIIYSDRISFISILKKYASKNNKTAVQFCKHLPQISLLDHGTANLLIELGYNLVSAEQLIQAYFGFNSARDIKSHESACRHLHEIVKTVWNKICSDIKKEIKFYESDIQKWILNQFKQRSLITDSPPIVGLSKNSALPHYFPSGRGALIKKNNVLQLDLWAKHDETDAIYADISWVGYLAQKADPIVETAFRNLIQTRDSIYNFIAYAFIEGRDVSGYDVDLYAEDLLKKAGYGAYIKHRTGHAIDGEVHGFGVNLDAREFPDHRKIAEGSCFSIEPGIYFEDFGLRTEIDVYIKGGKAVISGGRPQKELLLLGGGR